MYCEDEFSFGVDANVLLRVLLNDDPVQSAASREFLSSLGGDRQGYIGVPALLETFWVLRSRSMEILA